MSPGRPAAASMSLSWHESVGVTSPHTDRKATRQPESELRPQKGPRRLEPAGVGLGGPKVALAPPDASPSCGQALGGGPVCCVLLAPCSFVSDEPWLLGRYLECSRNTKPLPSSNPLHGGGGGPTFNRVPGRGRP